jgi:pimeloyl-ACP methyl ester carboxylesterase
MRILYVCLVIVVLLYIAYAGYFFAMQRSILFPRHLIAPPVPIPPIAGLEQMWLETSEGQIEAWYLPPLNGRASGPAPLCIIAHGNGDLIDNWLPSLSGLRRMGVGVLLVEYPGYGRSDGSPSQTAIQETFLLAYDAITRHPRVNPERIVLFGHSVGGGAVTALAAERPSAALILLSTFTSVRALATRQWLPGFAARDPFDSLAVVRSYPHPVLVIHGTYDRTIPYTHGVALHAAARQGELLTLDCDHNGCIEDWDQFWKQLHPFLVRAGILDI